MTSEGVNHSLVISQSIDSSNELRDCDERQALPESNDVCLVPEESEDESCQQLSASGAIDRIVRETSEYHQKQTVRSEVTAPAESSHPSNTHAVRLLNFTQM